MYIFMILPFVAYTFLLHGFLSSIWLLLLCVLELKYDIFLFMNSVCVTTGVEIEVTLIVFVHICVFICLSVRLTCNVCIHMHISETNMQC